MLVSFIGLLIIIIIPIFLVIFFVKIAIDSGFSIYKDLTNCAIVKVKRINLFEKQISEILRRKNVI